MKTYGPESAVYIGDGVYLHQRGDGALVLTTGHHDPREADNTIVLELGIWNELKRKAERLLRS